MVDVEYGLCGLSFDLQLQAQSRDATVTSNAGWMLPREVNLRQGLSALVERPLIDLRTKRTLHLSLPDLFLKSIGIRLAGYEDITDTEQPRNDLAVRMLASDGHRETAAALLSMPHGFQVKSLVDERTSLQVSCIAIQRMRDDAIQPITFDLERSKSPIDDTRGPSPPTLDAIVPARTDFLGDELEWVYLLAGHPALSVRYCAK